MKCIGSTALGLDKHFTVVIDYQPVIYYCGPLCDAIGLKDIPRDRIDTTVTEFRATCLSCIRLYNEMCGKKIF